MNSEICKTSLSTSEKVVIFCDRTIECCLYFFIFFLPFAKAAMQFFIWFAILLWIIKKFANNKNKEKLSPQLKSINILILFFVISCIVSTILSFNFPVSLRALLTKVGKQLAIFFIVVETINNNRKFKKILFVFLISFLLIIADAAVQYFTGKDFLRGYEMGSNRIQASFISSVGFSGWLIIMIPILLFLIFSKSFFRGVIYKIVFFILLLPLVLCLGLTYVRSSWLGLISSFILIFYFILKKIGKSYYKVFFILLVTLILFNIIIYLPQSIQKRILSIPTMAGSVPLRITLWKNCLKLISDFPIFGTGLNTYTKVSSIYSGTGGGVYSHNSYLQMTAEIGILGLFTFILFIYSLFKLATRFLIETNDMLLLGLLAAILAFLTQSFFDVNFYALQLVALFWFILGLVMARINVLASDRNSMA